MEYKVFKEKKDCCGCTACMNVCPKNAITMEIDKEGFKYPKIDKEKCIQCGLCKKTCAFQNGYDINGRLRNPIVYASKLRDNEVRKKSSSGGMFYAISDEILKQNGVVYGVAFDEQLKATHIRAQNEEQRNLCMGSKYSQSDLKDIYLQVKKDLEQGKVVLFTGTPCQIGGLNRFLENVDTKKLLLVDIVCHGTPSPKIFQDYIHFSEAKNNSKICEYFHRCKDRGWGGYEKAIYENGKTDYKSALVQVWNNIYFSNLATRPSCYQCKYTNTKRPSDITIADFWGINEIVPEFADKLGVSLTIINTEKGYEIWNRIKNKLDVIERTIEEAKKKNPQLERPIEIPENRDKFWKDYSADSFKNIAKTYGKYNIKNKIKQRLKVILKG